MRGTIKKRAQDFWSVILDVGRDPATGKRKQKWVTVKGTKAKAQQQLRKLLAIVDDGIPVDYSKGAVREYLTSWIGSVMCFRSGIALDPSTVDMLRAHRGNQLLDQVELCGAYQDQGLVFPGPLGGPVDPSVLSRNFAPLLRHAVVS